MGDRTYGQLVLIACPAEHAGVVAGIIDQYTLAPVASFEDDDEGDE